MKVKVLLFALIAVLVSLQPLMAGEADDFKFDRQQVQDEFADLNRLEQTVVQNDFMSLFELKDNNLLGAEFASMNLGTMMPEAALGIPGFWWGCVLGWVGLLIVYLVTDNDRDEVKSAFTGCIISTVVGFGSWLIYYLVILDSVM